MRKSKLQESASEEVMKKTVTIFDDSLRAVDLAFWGAYSQEEFKQGDIIIVKNGKLSSYGGVSVNVDSESSEIFVNDPKVATNGRVTEISAWY